MAYLTMVALKPNKISLKINIFQTNSLFGVLGNLSDWYRNILHKILGTCRKSL